jgi:beta-lactam-binding protein with PASTA domain
LLVAVAVFAVGCAQTTNSASNTTPETNPSSVAITSAPPSETAAPIPKTKVPKLEGIQLAKAQKLATRANLDVSFDKKYSHEPAGTVINQRPAAGQKVEEGTTIELVVAKAFPIVPNVVGLSLTQAERTLRKAGFEARVVKSGTSGTPGTVTAQKPAAGSEARPGIKVAITTPNCTPGYSPCLPPASDYDCAGGSGDGPKYTGLVRVTGSDPYGLDADNDGYGCE